MATVRISQALIEKVMRNANGSQEKMVQRAIDSRPSDDWAEKIYNILLGDSAHIAQQLPEHWFHMVDNIHVQQVGSTSCNLVFKFQTPMRWPWNIDNDLGELRYNGSNDVYLKDHLLWGELHAEVTAYQERVQFAKSRQSAFVAEIKAILNAYTTLAPALKAWPPLWDFIPEDVKNKHREVVAKEKKTEVSLDVDLSRLTAMATAAKIG